MDARHLVDKLLPRHCVLCRTRSDTNICAPCDSDLPVSNDPCHRCGIPIGFLDDRHSNGENPFFLCGRCILDPPPYDKTIAALDYSFPVTVLVQRFKFRRSLACGAVLSERLSRTLQSKLIDRDCLPEFLVPVPLHPYRQFTRVFNQAEILACDIGKELGLRVQSRILRRTRRTRSQPGLSAQERRKNLKGAVSARPINASHVALVDDVMTTGATVSECATALRRAGASSVSVWVAARAQCP